MAKGKLILICQSGGEFVTNDDGTMSYNGGEANAANVTSETPFNDLKLTLAETCNVDQKTATIKYFLPGNKRNLITIKNDKDVKRMIDFHGDAITAEVFVIGAAGFDRSALDMQANRPSGTKNEETANDDNTPAKKDETVKRGKGRPKKDDKVMKEDDNTPAKKDETVKPGRGRPRKDDNVSAKKDKTVKPGRGRPRKDDKANKEDDNVRVKKDEPVKRGRGRPRKDAKVTKEDRAPKNPPYASPAKRTRRSVAPTDPQTSSDEGSTDNSASEGSTSNISSSTSSDHGNKNPDADRSSDYAPSMYASRKKRNSQGETDVNASPADSVKKRRRTPSWKFGANGRPTIVSSLDDGSKSRGKIRNANEESSKETKSQRKRGRLADKADSSKETKSGRKRGRNRAVTQVSDNSDEEFDGFGGKDDLEGFSPLAGCDDDVSPETLVAAWKSAITGVGQEFANVGEFRQALKKYAIANRFAYKFKKNDTSRATGGCAAEGCSWKFYAVWVPATQSFKIKTLNNVHTCDKESRKSAHPTKNWLVSTIKERLRESPNLKPKQIANGLLRDFGVDLNYSQVWRGIGDAREQLHGSPKEAYNKLPWFCEKIVETNPGSIVNLVIGDKKRFKSLFVCFYASLCGFQNSCRPLLFLESTSLKSKYGEVLLTATAMDGNDGFFPFAFAIVDVEDDSSWHWFLEQLKAAILNSQPITFVFDREKNLKNSVLEVFEDAYIGYSIYHLLESFKKNVKGPFHGDGKAFLPVHFLTAAQAVRLVGFRKATEQIKQISSQAYDWVMQIETEHWTTSSFKGERYNYIVDDVGESYAKLMEDSRELPILHKIDAVIRMMIDVIGDAKLDASMWSTQLTASKERQLEEESLRSRGLKVLISSDTLFEVREDSTHVVNISNSSCTCLGWRETGLPCCHALAVLALIGRSPYEFCSGYFTVDAYRLTYAESINPVPIDQNSEPLLQKDEAERANGDQGHCKMEDGNMETGENTEKQDVFKEDYEMEDVCKEEGEKLDVEVVNEGAEKEEGSKVDAEKEEGSKLDAEKDGGHIVEAEKEEGSKLVDEKEEGENTQTENAGADKEESEKAEESDKAGGEKEDLEKAGDEKDKAEEEEGEKAGTGKEEGEKGKVREEHEDPNVLVLPPIPTKAAAVEKKEKVEWVETEGETKRTVTCTKCKQPGHNKKSCNLYQGQQTWTQ